MIELLKDLLIGSALICGILFLLFLALLLYAMIVNIWRSKW